MPLPTANDRKKLQLKAERALFELILSEPTGKRDVRAAMVQRTKAFVAGLRRDLYPAGQAAS